VPICAIVPNFIKIGQNGCSDTDGDLAIYLNGGRPPSCICWARIRTTHYDDLVVSIIVQNLVVIDAALSIT